MNYDEFPTLFRVTDSASVIAQKSYLHLVTFHLCLLIFGAALGISPNPTSMYSLLSALVFISALAVSIWLSSQKYEKQWYSCRAVAESVKTATWRYIMKAAPFGDAASIKKVNSNFRTHLNDILNSNNQVDERLTGNTGISEQISPQMTNIRNSSLEERKTIYLADRMDEQRQWYADKAEKNKRHGRYFYGLLIFFQVLAIGSVLIKIPYPQLSVSPTDVFVVIAGACVTWMQVKRFGELATSYALRANEISVARGRLIETETEQELSEFVLDAENAFSKEFKQWVQVKIQDKD